MERGRGTHPRDTGRSRVRAVGGSRRLRRTLSLISDRRGARAEGLGGGDDSTKAPRGGVVAFCAGICSGLDDVGLGYCRDLLAATHQ